MKRLVIVLVFCCLSALNLRGSKSDFQKFEYILQTYTTLDGLEDNFIYDISEAPDKTLWLSTRKGISKFENGVFISINEINSDFRYKQIEVDDAGNVWLAKNYTEKWGKDQIVIFQPKTGETITLNEYIVSFNNEFLDSDQWLLIKGRQGIRLRNQRLFKEYVVVDRMMHYSEPSIPNDCNIFLADFSDAPFSLETRNVDQINLVRNEKIAPLFFEEITVRKNEVYSKMYVEDRMLYRRLPGSHQFLIHIDDVLLSFTSKSIILFEDGFETVTNLYDMFPAEFSKNSIHKVLKVGNNYWIATAHSLFKITKRKKVFNSYVDWEILSCRDIEENEKNELLISTERGVFLLNTKTNQLDTLSKQFSYSVFKLSTTELISLGGRQKAVYLQKENSQWNAKYFPMGVVENATSYIMFKDLNGVFWCGTDKGLAKYNAQEKKFYNFQHADISFYDFAYSKDSALLYAQCDDGIFEIDMATSEGSFNPLFRNYVVSAIYHDQVDRNLCWVATRYEGLIKWDTKANTITKIKKKDGLSDNNVHSIYQDTLQRLWISTDYGISVLDKITNRIHVLLSEDGLHENEMNRHSYLYLGNGEIYYGTINGVVHFNVYDFEFQTKTSPVEFTLSYTDKINGNKETIDYQEVASQALYIDKNFIKPVLLLNRNSSKAKPVSYRYRSTDNSSWNYSKNNEIDLSTIKEGQTSLVIQKKIGPNEWELPKILLLERFSPLHRRAYFYPMVALLGILSVLFYLLYVNRKRRLLNVKIQRRVDEGVEEIATQNKRLKESKHINDTLFSIISHDLRSPLMGLTDLSKTMSILKNSGDYVAIQKLSESVDQNASGLLTTVNRLLEWSITQRSDLKLYKEFTVVNSINEVVDELQATIVNKDLQVEITNQGILKVNADSGSFKVLIYNLITNAIKFSSQDSIIEIEIISTGTRQVRIQDYGTGIDEDILSTNFNDTLLRSTKGTNNEVGFGLGLKICMEICSKMNWRLEIKNNKKGTLATIQFD